MHLLFLLFASYFYLPRGKTSHDFGKGVKFDLLPSPIFGFGYLDVNLDDNKLCGPAGFFGLDFYFGFGSNDLNDYRGPHLKLIAGGTMANNYFGSKPQNLHYAGMLDASFGWIFKDLEVKVEADIPFGIKYDKTRIIVPYVGIGVNKQF